MCELLGMSANVPTDICFSFSGLMQRGGATGAHRDGWGIAFYEGRAVREFRDPEPSCQSPIARLIQDLPIKSKTVISHIRQANVGEVSLENTHPFGRELWGRNWSFAHNGQLKDKDSLPLTTYFPVGSTDSERAFCWQEVSKCNFPPSEQNSRRYRAVGTTDSEAAFVWILNNVSGAFPEAPSDPEGLWVYLKGLADKLAEKGVCNLLFSDAEYLYAYCSTKLHLITRKAPFGEARLADTELTIDFGKETTPNDIVSVIATQPLTTDETWRQLEEGDFLVLKDGKVVFEL